MIITDKHIVILHTCHYVRYGLKQLLDDVLAPASTLTCINNLHEGQRYLLSLKRLDMVVIGLQGCDDTQVDSLCRLFDWLQRCHSACRIVVVVDSSDSAALACYVSQLRNITQIIALSSPVSTLRQRLVGSLYDGAATPQNAVFNAPVPLSLQEHKVFIFLLYGHSLSGIAQLLGVNYKTVNSYKRSAMHKLKIRTLPTLLGSRSDRQMMLQYLKHQPPLKGPVNTDYPDRTPHTWINPWQMTKEISGVPVSF